MRRFLLIALAAALPGLINAGPRPDAAIANPFDEGRLQDKTLRIDYMFTDPTRIATSLWLNCLAPTDGTGGAPI